MLIYITIDLRNVKTFQRSTGNTKWKGMHLIFLYAILISFGTKLVTSWLEILLVFSPREIEQVYFILVYVAAIYLGYVAKIEI